MQYLPIIGLEIHVQLKTATKMFCGCPNGSDDAPINTALCPVCTAQPGALPVPNEQAVAFGVKAALALNCKMNEQSKFDRKNYFYPDLPKGYQISQFDQPVGEHGVYTIAMKMPNGIMGNKKVGITRLHLEEDAAKLLHQDGKTVVDFNRAGSPLAEIVTDPDMHSAAEAKLFLQELRLLMRYLGVSDADMEKGQMRADVNVSLIPMDEKKDEVRWQDLALYPKTEVKNVNSFRNVERAVVYEIERQKELWEKGTPPMVTTTRGWDDLKQETVEQRTKEAAHDYRYFPEPDIPPMNLAVMAENVRLPELPTARRVRYAIEYGFAEGDIEFFVQDPAFGVYAEEVYSEFLAWIRSAGKNPEEYRAEVARLTGGWLTSKLMGRLSERKQTIADVRITPEDFAEFLHLILENKVNSTNAQKLLDLMLETGADPSHIMEDHALGQVQDTGLIEQVVATVLMQNPEQVAQFRAGKIAVLPFFIGLCMKATQGAADPKMVKEELERQLNAS